MCWLIDEKELNNVPSAVHCKEVQAAAGQQTVVSEAAVVSTKHKLGNSHFTPPCCTQVFEVQDEPIGQHLLVSEEVTKFEEHDCELVQTFPPLSEHVLKGH